MSSILAPKFVTRPDSSISRSNPNSNQAKLDRLNTMAQRGPLSQTNQRNLAYLQNKMGVTPGEIPPYAPQDTGMPKATLTGKSQAPQPYNPYDVETLKKLNPNFSDNFGNTSVKNLNTIGAPAPAGATSTLQNTQSTVNGMPPPNYGSMTMKKGGKVKAKKMASGGMTSKVSSASSRADGIAQRGKTKCKIY